MKVFYCLFLLILSSGFAHSESFKINSFQYIDSTYKPNEAGSKIVFTTDRQVSCDGQTANKVFVDKNHANVSSTVYLLLRFWPSYFLKQAAAVNAEVDLALGGYDPDLDACAVGLRTESSNVARWYEPYEFTVSELDDSNPINTVYYQLYINGRSPTYAPWVYADTDFTVSCDGQTTNRIIPTTNPVEGRYYIPNEFGSNVNPYYSSENTRSFFDLMTGKLDSYTVGKYVPELDACTVYHVEFSGNSSYAQAIEIGMQQCIENPEVCNLFSREEVDLAIQLGLQDGMNSCIEDPATCGLFDQSALDSSFSNGMSTGVQNCVDSPDSCGLFDQTSLDTSYTTGLNEGVQNCVDDPANCGLFNQISIDLSFASGIDEGIQSCITNPENCGLFDQTAIDASMSNGKELGVQSCIDNPASCGLYNQGAIDSAFSNGKNTGVESCITDPASCGLFDQAALNHARTQGIFIGEQNCKNNPASCGLFEQADIDRTLLEGTENGKAYCKANPQACELFDLAALQGAFSEGEATGKAACIADPASCNLYDLEDVTEISNNHVLTAIEQLAYLMPKGVIKKICKKHPDSLLCLFEPEKKDKDKKDKKDKKEGKDKKGNGK